MKKAFILHLFIFSFLTMQAQDFTNERFPLTTSVKTMDIGNMNILDPYLSPYEYSGFQIGLFEENRRLMPSIDTLISYTSRKSLSFGSGNHPSKNNSMLMFNGNYNFGLNYHIRLHKNFLVLVGGSWDIDLGGKYISRNVNNPFSLDLYTNLNATAELFYRFKLKNQSLQLHYGFQTPVAGSMFVPMQGASYYELFTLSNMSNAIHFSSLHNKRGILQNFQLDLPLKIATIRLGIQHELMQYSANEMIFHKKSLTFSVGYRVDMYTFTGRKNKVPSNFISAYE